jgi:uncharacterized OB-fold protein
VSTLTGSTCASCGESFFPQRLACPRCGGTLGRTELSGKGDVYSYTLIEQAPAGFEDQAPYIVALVHLAEGPYVSARLSGIDLGSVFIGLPVEAVAGDNGRAFCVRRSLVE